MVSTRSRRIARFSIGNDLPKTRAFDRGDRGQARDRAASFGSLASKFIGLQYDMPEVKLDRYYPCKARALRKSAPSEQAFARLSVQMRPHSAQQGGWGQ